MTDLENREAFDKWFKKNFHDLHEAICCGDLVAKNYKKAMFKAWNASIQRQGFKLVPNLFIADIHDMALDGKYLRETDQTQDKFEEIQEYCKEVMINAV